MTFLELMQKEIQPAMDKIADGKKMANQAALDAHQCVTLKIDNKNYTWHVNFPTDSEQGGRSYGEGPGGKVSDPSDAYYLGELDKFSHSGPEELGKFYKALIEVIANCDSSEFAALSDAAQVVATDFVAIYTAEEKRHLIGHLGSFKWDDAIFQVTMLAAFHGGQKSYAQFYQGKFTDQVYDQKLKVYKQPDAQEGKDTRKANLVDYWQWSPNQPTRSGINLTRGEFEKMGKTITSHEQGEKDSKEKLEAVEKLIGVENSENIYSDIATFFINKDAPEEMSAQSKDLADAISAFLVQVNGDAATITTDTFSLEQ
jgi:hypothetical protein